ncbi:hypothetical protein CA51_20280 [Rosistilla oblonga]|nr:hypothetical protein CA51_20280 [Rosistilla oblonga]
MLTLQSWLKTMLLAIGLIVASLVGAVGAFAQAAVAPVDTAEQEKEADAKKATSEYLRITKLDNGKPDSMETSIVRFEGPAGSKYAGRVVDLIGVVHIGQKEYYEQLNQRFADYDRVLYELVAPEGTTVSKEQAGEVRGPLGAMQLGMKDILNLDFQLEHIDYDAKNFRHADMSPEEFAADMAERGDSVMKMVFRMLGSGMATQAAAEPAASDTALLFALFAPDRARRMKQIMASQFEDMEIATAAMADATGKSTIITERNAKAFSVLADELQRGSRKVAVFYGAGHLPDMADRLRDDFQMKKTQTEWFQAWDLQKN